MLDEVTFFIQEMQIKLYNSKGDMDQLKSGSLEAIAKTKHINMYLHIFTDVLVCFQYVRKFG